MKRLTHALDWFLRTGFCTIWLFSAAMFIFNSAAGASETDPDTADKLIIRAGCFGIVMLFGMLAHAYLIHDHKKKYPPEDNGDYNNLDF